MPYKTNPLIIFLLTSFILSCNSSTKTPKGHLMQNTPEDTLLSNKSQDIISGDYCFLKVENRDSTFISLRILSEDDIRGEMIWQPWQSGGAVGSLTGKMNENGEMELLYDYTIEGSQQTELKIMKIENKKLLIKIGELVDVHEDGHLTYKNENEAEFTEILESTPCQ